MRILYLSQSPSNPMREERHDRIQQQLRSYCSAGTELDFDYPDDFPGARVLVEMGARKALSGLHHTMEAPALVAKAVWGRSQGYDAIVQSNTFDPGVEASRLAVDIPVIGLLRTALHVATMLATRVGILVPLSGHIPYTWRLVASYGMSSAITDIRSVDMYGLDLAERKDEVFGKAAEVIKQLVAQSGAEFVIPLGAALIPYVVSVEDLQEATNVPLINTSLTGIRIAELCVAGGMRQSPLAYPHAGLDLDSIIGPESHVSQV